MTLLQVIKPKPSTDFSNPSTLSTIIMAKLVLATKADQSDVIPALLVATLVNESQPKAGISLQFEDTNVLKTGEKAVVEWTSGDHSPVYGTETVIKEILVSFPILGGKHDKLVRHQIFNVRRLFTDFGRRTNGSHNCRLSMLSISSPWKAISFNSTPTSRSAPILWDTPFPSLTLQYGAPFEAIGWLWDL